ncbi:MAG TPA: NADH-quinone oxidoreductase subunit NuoH [Dehalococcoidia bacterium]|jgi:NADH-quinone oxidoreductase subunit H|nr:NADH-quinone oxidoreductase subunit NuoH [Dehalococcoidia bacterium]
MNCQLEGFYQTNFIYRSLHDIMSGLVPCNLSIILSGLMFAFLLVNLLLASTAIMTWGERRLLGRFQTRIGPNRWGPFGLLQPIADLVKLLFKENLIPTGADKFLFIIAPIIIMVPVIMVMGVIPLAPGVAMANLNIGILYILAITSVSSLGIFIAGWASNNRFAIFGAVRGVAVLISYEVPVVISLLGIVVVTGSMSLLDIVEAQALPFIMVQPMALLVFFIGSSAEMNRTPFDIAEAESEIIAGYHIEFSGIKFAVIQAAEYGAMIVTSIIIAVVFLGGWSGPLPLTLGWLWLIIKVLVVIFVFTWVRATFPRLRIDQIMAFCWKGLLPMSLINLFAVVIETFILKGSENSLSLIDLWIMCVINTILAVITVIVLNKLVSTKIDPAMSKSQSFSSRKLSLRN